MVLVTFEKINERYAIRSITNLIKRLGLGTEAKQTRQGRTYSIKEEVGNVWLFIQKIEKRSYSRFKINKAANVLPLQR